MHVVGGWRRGAAARIRDAALVAFTLVACAPRVGTEAPAGQVTLNSNPAASSTQTVTGETPAAAARAAAIAAGIGPILERAVRDSAFPGAIAVVGTRSGISATVAVGHLDWKPSALVDARTVWDLASLTKVVATTSAIAQLAERGKVDLDAPAVRYLPRWNAPRIERITVRHLLSHSSGLPSWRPLYKEAQTRAEALALVYQTAPDTVPGARYVYSDLGAILLGEIVVSVSGRPLDQYLREYVFGPLKMRETVYRPGGDLRERAAPTEFDPWRQRHLKGEVHDENCYVLGQVTGHAGLFSTADDLARFARMYLGEGELDTVRVLEARTIQLFTHVQDSALSHRALGWETPTGNNSGGHFMSGRAFGHTGFTGTSLWIDPGRDLFILLLTNRVNPTRENSRIGPVRVAVADAVARALDPSLPPPVRAR